ncbi:protein FAM240C [Embiotoca jacksoni]|uniref:protein FAM240C n=1 Tax=Embiotoca jacksoni TaxID=100190 RepID=UPI00370458DE
MNVALIHDRLHIQTFWEKRITDDSHHGNNEEQRMKCSSLNKLRAEWVVRLENRTKHLKNDKYVRKVKTEKKAEQT